MNTGERAVYLFIMPVRFQTLAELPASWHADAPHVSISAVNQCRLCLLEITDSLFVFLLQAATSIALLISQILCIVFNIKTIINHQDWKTGACPSLRAQGYEKDIAFTVCPIHPAVYHLTVSLKSVCLPVIIATCLPVISWWLHWLACELQWLGQGCPKHFVVSAVGKVIMSREVW